MILFTEIVKSPKMYIDHKRPQIAKAIMRYKCLRYHKAWLQIKLQSIITKPVSYWHQRIEDPEINWYSYSHLILHKGAKSIYWKKGSLFNKLCCENWISTCRRLKLDPYLSPYKNQFKMDQRLTCKTWNFENTRTKYRETISRYKWCFSE
jgi:hypothetical protein